MIGLIIAISVLTGIHFLIHLGDVQEQIYISTTPRTIRKWGLLWRSLISGGGAAFVGLWLIHHHHVDVAIPLMLFIWSAPKHIWPDTNYIRVTPSIHEVYSPGQAIPSPVTRRPQSRYTAQSWTSYRESRLAKVIPWPSSKSSPPPTNSSDEDAPE